MVISNIRICFGCALFTQLSFLVMVGIWQSPCHPLLRIFHEDACMNVTAVNVTTLAYLRAQDKAQHAQWVDKNFHYLLEYNRWCQIYIQSEFYRSRSADWDPSYYTEEMNLCPCVPEQLSGPIAPNLTEPFPEEFLALGEETLINGEWKPDSCTARQRVAIIIPFRDRESHLHILLRHLHPILQRQMLHYRVFVVEQRKPMIFNKAALMNACFLEAKKLWDFDCVVFQDVDMLMEDDRNFYTCRDGPSHLGAYVDKFNYSIAYTIVYGGVTAMLKNKFEALNGFSNRFYGWGGEDDDIRTRIRLKRWDVYRPPESIARYTMIKHKPDHLNPYNPDSYIGWRSRPATYVTDGLNTVQYHVYQLENKTLYTWILTDITAGGYSDHKFRTREGDCPGYDLTSVMNQSIFQCEFMCNFNEKCASFAYRLNSNSTTLGSCYFKNKSCEPPVADPSISIHDKIFQAT